MIFSAKSCALELCFFGGRLLFVPSPTIFNAWSSPSHALYYYYHNYYSYYPYYLDSGRGHLSGWPFWRCCYLLGENNHTIPTRSRISRSLSLSIGASRTLWPFPAQHAMGFEGMPRTLLPEKTLMPHLQNLISLDVQFILRHVS